ncbi:hypothetical protein [Streptomyces sp. NPDC047108]|uniref:hypothetical protein n=1 Tax=Streptomyces sp. NPDC047108 TaxID=3155025 RepID=UPI0033F29C0B
MKRESPETAELEERLRAALAARSALVTAQSLRPLEAGQARRWPRPLPALGAAVAAALLAIVAVVTFPHPLAEQERPASVTPSQQVDLRGVSFRVPRGWKAWQPERGGQACVQPPGVRHDMDPCWATGIQVATRTGDQSGAMDEDNWPMALLNCWTEKGEPDSNSPMTDSRLVERDTLQVSGQRVAYRAWRVTCRSGQEFTARLWWIPRHEISIRAMRLDSRDVPLAEELVSSLVVR